MTVYVPILATEVRKLLDYKTYCDADVEDSASMQRHGIIESLLPTQNNRNTKCFPTLT